MAPWQHLDPDTFYAELVKEIKRQGFDVHLFPLPNQREYRILVEDHGCPAQTLCWISLYAHESRISLDVTYGCESHPHDRKTFSPVRVRAKTLAREILTPIRNWS